MIAAPYILAGAAALSLIAGTYAGSQIEHARHVSREAASAARIEAARAKIQTAFDAVATKAAEDVQTQTTTFTEIRHVAGPIVYRNTNVCLPAGDGSVGLLDAARNAANGVAAGEPDGAAAAATGVPAGR